MQSLHPDFAETLDVLSRPPVIERTRWDDFLERLEFRIGRDLDTAEEFAAAYSAHIKGIGADEYALTVQAGECG